MTTRAELSQMFDEGAQLGHGFMIVVCDTYDYENYPVYTSAENFASEYEKVNGVNMQRVMEVYDLALDKEMQLLERRVFHYPAGFVPINQLPPKSG